MSTNIHQIANGFHPPMNFGMVDKSCQIHPIQRSTMVQWNEILIVLRGNIAIKTLDYQVWKEGALSYEIIIVHRHARTSYGNSLKRDYCANLKCYDLNLFFQNKNILQHILAEKNELMINIYRNYTECAGTRFRYENVEHRSHKKKTNK